MDATPAARLSRAALQDTVRPAAPVRIVHLGLGAFHRAHQAWYTAHASDAADWGIAAFTGLLPRAADALDAQDGLYTLVRRGPESDTFEIVDSIVSARPGTDVAAFVALLASPRVAVLTLTVTEAGYRLGADGRPDQGDPAVAADTDLLRAGLADPRATLTGLRPTTALGRVLLGLEARRRAGAPGLAVVPCDNLPDNGPLVRRALGELAARVHAPLADWLPEGVSVVSTSVDRITPRPTAADRAEVLAKTGWTDDAAVVTEPFTDWVLAGDFPSGRPRWESAGARVVDDITPWESRKLWMLNGAHTALAALGAVRGHRLVAEAIADPVCRALVERLWDDDQRRLGDAVPGLAAYRASLVTRFAHPRIEYELEQIAQDAFMKVRVRIVPVALAERAAGRPAAGCADAVGAWILAVRQGWCATPDTGAPDGHGVHALLASLDAGLAADAGFRAAVEEAVDRLDRKGVFTRDRGPRAAAHALREPRTPLGNNTPEQREQR